eukprot:g3575.t1
MEEKRCEYLLMIQDWKDVYNKAFWDLDSVITFLESVQPIGYSVHSNSIIELFDKTKNMKLDSYVRRGCRKVANSMGWNAARLASNAYNSLVANKEALNCLKSRLWSLVRELFISINLLMQTNVNWRQLDQSPLSPNLCFSSSDILLLMVGNTENIEKEYELLETVINSVSIFSRITELKSQMIILKLRPYDQEHITETLKNLKVLPQESKRFKRVTEMSE